MSNRIQLLPDHVANQIAAGEVVQRPSSVVKELMENAIDAGATKIQLIVKDAGKVLIQVIDNGCGMNKADARLSFERHATSKIKVAEDLFRLNTKGFRGEALASIGAIAHVVMRTKEEGQEVGSAITMEGSAIVEEVECVTPVGTSISVKNLFYNIPARRNFLKSNSVELRHILDEFHRVVLSHPDIRFEMHHNDTEIFGLFPSNLRQRIVAVFGGKTNEKLVPVMEETEVVKIQGYVGKPEFAKRRRGEQFFFINNRFVKNPYLHHAVTNAYEGLLGDKTHPSYFIYLEVDPQSIDINIHPTKTEIKFDDDQVIYAMMRSCIKHSLGQFSVAPVLDFTHDKTLDTPYSFKDKSASHPTISVDSNFNPFGGETTQFESKSNNLNTQNYKSEAGQSWEGLYAGLSEKDRSDETVGVTEFSSLSVEDDVTTGSLFIESGTENSEKNIVFQLHRKYIVTTIKSGMLVIHQNRAHRRVLYEELLRTITMASAVSQQLLFPLEISLTSREILLFKEIKEHLELAGFVFNAIKANGIEISALPVAIPDTKVNGLLEYLFEELEQDIPNTGFSQTDILANAMATKLAVSSGTLMEEAEMQFLVNTLFACTEPTVTPDNKPIFITLEVDDLDKKF